MFRRLFFCIVLLIFAGSRATAEHYAVLITGSEPDTTIIWQGNYNWFWNDTFLMWESLYQLGWKDENIFVLFGNGSDWYWANYNRYDVDEQYPDLSIDHIVDDSAYYNDVIETFDYLDSIMTEDDFLFVWTFDHGRIDTLINDTVICLMDSQYISDDEFAQILDNIDYEKRVIWMAQCYSGGFSDDLSNNNTFFMSACADDESSYRADNIGADGGDSLEWDYVSLGPDTFTYYHHSEFNYHSFNALRLKTVIETNELDSVDINNDGLASLIEIFKWNSMKCSIFEVPVVPGDAIWLEHPQFSDPGGIGDEIFLDIPPFRSAKS